MRSEASAMNTSAAGAPSREECPRRIARARRTERPCRGLIWWILPLLCLPTAFLQAETATARLERIRAAARSTPASSVPWTTAACAPTRRLSVRSANGSCAAFCRSPERHAMAAEQTPQRSADRPQHLRLTVQIEDGRLELLHAMVVNEPLDPPHGTVGNWVYEWREGGETIW